MVSDKLYDGRGLYKVVVAFSDNTTTELGWYSDYKQAEDAYYLYLEFPYHQDAMFIAIVKDGFMFKKQRVDYADYTG